MVPALGCNICTYDQNVCAFSLSFYIFKIAEKLYEGKELGLERFEYVAMHVLLHKKEVT